MPLCTFFVPSTPFSPSTSGCKPLQICTTKPRISRPHHAPPRANYSGNPPSETTLIPETEALDPNSGSVVVPPSYNLPAFFLFTGGYFTYKGDILILPGLPFILLGLLLSIQSLRIRFIFGPTKLSVAQRTPKGLKIIRGWQYEKIVNWELWWKKVPVLAYFKEKESYNGRGSVHFFPAIAKGNVLLQQLQDRLPHLDKPQYK